MIEINYSELATERLAEAGFFSKSLADLELEQVNTVAAGNGVVRFSAYGSLEVEMVVVETLPGTVALSDPSIQLRLKAHHTALGAGQALVGVELYNPKDMKFNHSARKAIAHGSFRPFADRLFRTINHLGLGDDQRLALFGYSLGADVNVETAHQNLTNENRGSRQIDSLGVYEPCRMRNRGRLALQRAMNVSAAFSKSGPDLFKNIVDTGSPALLGARGIDVNDPDAKKNHDKAVAKDVAKYTAQDLVGNIAITSGLGCNDSLWQLVEICKWPDMPSTTVSRMERTTMNPPGFPFTLLNHAPATGRLRVLSYNGDHSLADNLRQSAAFVLQTVNA